MKVKRLLIICAAIACIGVSCSPSTHQNNITASDPLDQWNEGPAKASILNLVESDLISHTINWYMFRWYN